MFGKKKKSNEKRELDKEKKVDKKKNLDKKKQGRETNLLLSKNVKITHDARKIGLGCENVLVVGSTGTGKSFMYLKPNIYSLPTLNGKPCSIVVTDPKGENAENTAEFLRQHGYIIKILNLNEPKYSDCYNPFKYVRSDKDLEIVIDTIVTNALGDGGKEPFWNDQSKALLGSIAFYLYYERPYKEQNFANIRKILNMCGDRDEQKRKPSTYEGMLASLEKSSPLGKMHPAIDKYSSVRDSKGNTFTSILSNTQGAVRVFNMKDMARLTMTDTLELDLTGDRPTALYVITSTTNRTFDFLVSLIYTQMFETLLYRANTVYAKQGHSLPHHILFFLDEFANIAQIPDFDKKIAVFRQANISCSIIVQTLNQIESIYDKKAANIIGNCSILLFLGNSDVGKDGVAEQISNILGDRTILMGTPKEENEKKKSILMNGVSYREDLSKTSRKLMTPDEVRRLPNDECVIVIAGQLPFRDKKITPMDALNYEEANKLFYDIPTFKQTNKSYKKGLAEAAKKDEEIKKMRIEEALEDAKFDEFEVKEKMKTVPNEHIMPMDAVMNDFSDDDINEADFMEKDSVVSFSPTHEWDMPDGKLAEKVIISESWDEDGNDLDLGTEEQGDQDEGDMPDTDDIFGIEEDDAVF